MSVPSIASFRQGESAVAVVGLGYVGLPLAVAFARHFKVIGFDLNDRRVRELASGHDRTGEVTSEALKGCSARFTSDPAALREARAVIVAVPTPIDEHRNPDLSPVEGASRTVGRNLSEGTVVVYESTVYPGVTEEICLPILEAESGLRCGIGFTMGYSPERINPGDKVHTLETIKKIVSGSDAPTLDLLAELYGTVVKAGIHRAPSIKVAEAAKVIENTQRDLNIALMNELSIIFDRLGIDTLDVLEAAGTKWNFLPFRPGLVGGHCIGVDPYYLTFKAEELGCHPQVILAGRRINDEMGKHVAETCVKLLIRQGRLVNAARVGVLGFTFKENVPDLRNTRVIDVIRELREYGVEVLVHDPLADADEVRREYGLSFASLEALTELDALIVTVPHRAYAEQGVLALPALHARFADPDKALLLDVKGHFSPAAVDAEGMAYWRL
uniref:nucleotide sugar dehydrogenase n=1 Tax=uncultured Bilophila sp. TaxID=529385 RepID=UPI0025DC9281|nr:nucleotide sugar dehydrogenase [uncultured Bilophila sp.]